MTVRTVTFWTLVGFFHLTYYKKADLMNDATQTELGPVTRYMKAEAKVEHLQMLLINLSTAACPYAHDPDASDALIEAHREATEELGMPCIAKYLSED